MCFTKERDALNKGLSWCWILSNEKGQSPNHLISMDPQQNLKENFKRQTRKAQSKKAKPNLRKNVSQNFLRKTIKKKAHKKTLRYLLELLTMIFFLSLEIVNGKRIKIPQCWNQFAMNPLFWNVAIWKDWNQQACATSLTFFYYTFFLDYGNEMSIVLIMHNFTDLQFSPKVWDSNQLISWNLLFRT